MKEKFVTLRINGIDTDYLISNKARIMTKNGEKQKATQISHTGYEKVAIQINKKPKLISVHRAMYESFVGDIPPGMVINHKDGNKLNNQLSNLEVCTVEENAQHAWRTGLCHKQDRHGEKNTNCFHTAEQAVIVYSLLKNTNHDHMTIAKMVNVDIGFVDGISKGRWADITGYKRDEVCRNHKFTKEEEIVIWTLYSAGVPINRIVYLLDLTRNNIDNKIGYIRRHKKKRKKMDELILKEKSRKIVNNFLIRWSVTGYGFKDDDND